MPGWVTIKLFTDVGNAGQLRTVLGAILITVRNPFGGRFSQRGFERDRVGSVFVLTPNWIPNIDVLRSSSPIPHSSYRLRCPSLAHNGDNVVRTIFLFWGFACWHSFGLLISPETTRTSTSDEPTILVQFFITIWYCFSYLLQFFFFFFNVKFRT